MKYTLNQLTEIFGGKWLAAIVNNIYYINLSNNTKDAFTWVRYCTDKHMFDCYDEDIDEYIEDVSPEQVKRFIKKQTVLRNFK